MGVIMEKEKVQPKLTKDKTEVESATEREALRERRIPINTAEPPPEVTEILKKQGLPEGKIEGWLAVPSINPPTTRISRKEIATSGQVDAYELLAPFLGKDALDQTLRTVDLLNGCGHHCDVCLADSALPSGVFSYDSLERLFSDERFLKMLQPDSIRIGSSGDILDHPRAKGVVTMMLEKTEALDRQRMVNEDKHHLIKIFTNYRHRFEEQLDELIEVAKQNPERIRLTISLPFNRTDAANSKFNDYALGRSGVFGTGHEIGDDGLLNVFPWAKDKMKNVNVQDVRHPRLLFMSGRILSEEINAGRVPEWDKVEYGRTSDFEHRGLVKTYLNPDALWLMIYATPFESHTGRVFTPISLENLDAISHLPYHLDFPAPPSWPGGTGIRKNYKVGERLKREMEEAGRIMRTPTVIE